MLNKILEEFRDEYKKTYKGILSDELLSEGNSWFERFISTKLQEYSDAISKLITDEIRIAQRENQPTSRLTSLYNKINKL